LREAGLDLASVSSRVEQWWGRQVVSRTLKAAAV